MIFKWKEEKKGEIRKKEEKKSTPFVCVCVVYAHLYYPSSFYYLKNNFFGREKSQVHGGKGKKIKRGGSY
jgi:hypothetical protein